MSDLVDVLASVTTQPDSNKVHHLEDATVTRLVRTSAFFATSSLTAIALIDSQATHFVCVPFD